MDTNWIPRLLLDQLRPALEPNKVIMLVGARRIGKTALLQKLAASLPAPYLWMNGEDFATAELLARRTEANYRQLLGEKRILLIDEAQKIPDIGWILKLMVDTLPGIQIVVTGSSAFDMHNTLGEPLTGRKKTFHLFPLAEEEWAKVESPMERKDRLRERLVFGSYPEIARIQEREGKAAYLSELVHSYLLKDIFSLEGIRSANKIKDLLRLLAFQVGEEVSAHELGRQLGMSKNTVDKYLDLLEKFFVVYSLSGFSRNLRKEIVKNRKWYFVDNGLRNVLISNLNPLELRNDQGKLWENYILSERVKHQHYRRMLVNNYFWRTYDQQEIDWIEEREGALFAYECKWNPAAKASPPVAWQKAYPESRFSVIHPENYTDWVL
ncbi:MAG: ATP-binding protein [Haliscomenobacter sp.]|nr:ATP-binding protein [Haliscomenobacter sp.]